jgi:hypothetical protein
VGWLVHADGRFACQLPLLVAYCVAFYQAGNLENEELGQETFAMKFNGVLWIWERNGPVI